MEETLKSINLKTVILLHIKLLLSKAKKQTLNQGKITGTK